MRRARSRNRAEVSFWQAYSDIMASILMVTVLVLTGAILNAQRRVMDREDRLNEETVKLKTLKEEADQQEMHLKQQAEQIQSMREAYSEQTEKLQSILGVKQEIIEELVAHFKGEAQLRINEQTGAIMFDSKLLFDKNEYELKESDKNFLDQFIPIYMEVLSDERFRDQITEIIVAGHADTTGEYLYNLELSQERALSVVSYFLSDNSGMFAADELEKLREIVTANGRSFSAPILDENGEVNLELSRRVEIQFRLTDEQMIRDMIALVNEDAAEKEAN